MTPCARYEARCAYTHVRAAWAASALAVLHLACPAAGHDLDLQALEISLDSGARQLEKSRKEHDALLLEIAALTCPSHINRFRALGLTAACAVTVGCRRCSDTCSGCTAPTKKELEEIRQVESGPDVPNP
jgi:hypothetical protein